VSSVPGIWWWRRDVRRPVCSLISLNRKAVYPPHNSSTKWNSFFTKLKFEEVSPRDGTYFRNDSNVKDAATDAKFDANCVFSLDFLFYYRVRRNAESCELFGGFCVKLFICRERRRNGRLIEPVFAGTAGGRDMLLPAL
jgi:hypothetical protein